MIDGFLIIDKPPGITSHDVVSRVRRILGIKKVGHTGTLDPFATGVLPVAVNNGTKVIPFLDEGCKTYEAVILLGVTTDTLDMTGVVLSESDSSRVTPEQLAPLFSSFTGAISQIPPMYSAIKQNGQPLYKLARQGVQVERKARYIEIYSLEIISFDLPLVTARVVCSRGTYIRSLADDIGQRLGCGAALKELRRTVSGPFRIEDSVTLTELEAAAEEGRAKSLCLLPSAALGHLPEIPLTAEGVQGLRFGKSPPWRVTSIDPPLTCREETVVRLTADGTLVAVAIMTPVSGTDAAIKLKRVLE